MKIVVDAMGGDFAPEQIVKGTVDAVREYDVSVILCGDEEKVGALVRAEGGQGLPIEIVHAQEVIGMGEPPVTAVRRKKNSSIVVATRLVKEGKGDAVVSAGSTGAAMAAALFILGRIKGIDRPAIASIIPTVKGLTLLIDVGANATCTPENLYQFGMMGSIYAEKIMGIPTPRVGLLNIGEEEGKGNETVQEAYELLKNSALNFIGNVEGRDITAGKADVIVCEGFVGNVVLKFGEGLARDLLQMIKEEVKKDFLARLGAMLFFSRARGLRRRIDHREYGGAPLLGVDGVCIIAHGSSDRVAVKNAIRVAKECLENNVNGLIKETLMAVEQS
ncbi:MAG: phosphate acyltransferase [Eubacteriales bacterium]|nr:phosphate acyltransferase [Eubacteriales bacterium]